MAHHSTLTAERWDSFTLEQQILMIANELQRAAKQMGPGDGDRRRGAYARALTLTDLTASGAVRPNFRRELLRWRDLLASLYLGDDGGMEENAAVLRHLLRFKFSTSRQIQYL
ncbi:MAG TPA: hypothetical protein VK123_03845 [Candidatus Limnocylindrales bacterium]|nr:hypothetical protein [Candidatus Limnocylindrales bacterium]